MTLDRGGVAAFSKVTLKACDQKSGLCVVQRRGRDRGQGSTRMIKRGPRTGTRNKEQGSRKNNDRWQDKELRREATCCKILIRKSAFLRVLRLYLISIPKPPPNYGN
jgi:hypothetical protein